MEAISSSTSVLMSGSRMAAATAPPADPDRQIGPVAQHEVTEPAAMVSTITYHLCNTVEADAGDR
jgi:hypothetical protein